MERNTPVRKPRSSTADLLTWSETPPPDSSAVASAASRSAARSHQPSDGITKVVFGGQVTDEESQDLNKRKPCSGYKMKEMTGSGIFVANEEDEEEEAANASATPNNRTGLRMYQHAVSGISHISFAEEESLSPKKPSTLTEVAKQRELSGTLVSDADAKLMKQLSNAKCKELSGCDIFAPPPEILPRHTTARTFDLGGGTVDHGESRNGHAGFADEPMKTAKKLNNKKFSELSGNDIFNVDANPNSTDKSISVAKLREISGNDIFADGKVEARDYLGGVRKPPGGESSIALV